MPGPAPVMVDLVKNAAQTQQRLTREACTWTCTFELPDNTQVRLERTSTPKARRTILSTVAQGSAVEAARIIERDGVWYVTESGTPLGKFRPYEVVFPAPVAYLYLRLGELRYATQEVLQGLQYGDTANGIAKYHEPLDPKAAQQREVILKLMDLTLTMMPAGPDRKKMEEEIRRIKLEMDKGRSIEVDVASGVVRRFTHQGNIEVTFSGPEWKPVPDKELDVSGVAWKDYGADPTMDVDLNDLMMISHNRAWKPGMSEGDTDCCLINVKTGECRRVPFVGVGCTPGCFLKDRSRVVVSGMDALGCTFPGLYEIDLRTGANRRLGDERLEGRICGGSCLSPDGRMLAFVSSDFATEELLAGQVLPGQTPSGQVTLLDLETNTTSPVGAPFDASSLSWLPDGKGLILVERKITDPQKPSEATICRLDLQGGLKRIRKGDSPVLLPDGETLLYDRDGKWLTCDLQGKHSKSYAASLPKAASPSACPDGKRMFWMTLEDRPIPCVGKLGSAKLKPVTKASGLWANPQWR